MHWTSVRQHGGRKTYCSFLVLHQTKLDLYINRSLSALQFIAMSFRRDWANPFGIWGLTHKISKKHTYYTPNQSEPINPHKICTATALLFFVCVLNFIIGVFDADAVWWFTVQLQGERIRRMLLPYYFDKWFYALTTPRLLILYTCSPLEGCVGLR